ncbi:hypothetical protein FGG08_002549 [Glutinoglossum americanum]|uniref:DUF7580 domain-containing protein n=1 Tax=Glutinoglossum americanum TaxID=1670608 RepID=A0A9P8I641_9PEZI|nr:hypothetical protein FGG08_002549 [Glutinoglossum americanum]
MKDYESVFENLHTSFITGLSIYRDSCEQLLSPLMLPDNKFYELLEKPEGNAWKDAELGESLHERLGSDYGPYRSSIKQLNKKIILFSKKLKLDDDMRPPWITKDGTVDVAARDRFFGKPLTRIKGGFDSNRYANLLAEIVGDINQVAALTKGAIALEPLRLERKRRINAAYWVSIRDHARRLFETLSSRWSCACSCKNPHRAHLRLDVRNGGETRDRSIRFGFLFSFDINASTAASLPWDWRDVEIEPLQTPNTPCTLALTLAFAVLQLHDTPWLSRSWGMKDIYFIKSKEISLVSQPYVSKSFAPTPCPKQSTQLKSRSFIKNEMVFALGIALLELSYGKPILSFKTAEDLDSQGNETNFTEFSIANRLIETIETRELTNYARAVIRCIRCNFETFTYSLDDDDFRERFYQSVILPLQQDYEYATSASGQTY